MVDYASLLDVVDESYQLDRTDQAWLQGVVDAACPVLDRGMGVIGHTFRTNAEGQYELLAVSTAGGMTAAMADAIGRALTSYSPEEAQLAPEIGCGTISQMFTRVGRPFAGSRVYDQVSPFGIRDAVGFSGKDPAGRGYAIVSPLPTEETVAPAEEARWIRVALHALAVMRLRASSASPEPEAILDSRHRVVHAEGPAQTALDSLRRAAVAVDRARSRSGRRDPDGALEAWRALVRGRWSLVDRFESDGRRYIVAVGNEPDATGPAGLTKREVQVLSYAARGLSNKAIAYALGLAQSTVSSHVRSGTRKLRLKSRRDLAAIFPAAPGGRVAPGAP